MFVELPMSSYARIYSHAQIANMGINPATIAIFIGFLIVGLLISTVALQASVFMFNKICRFFTTLINISVPSFPRALGIMFLCALPSLFFGLLLMVSGNIFSPSVMGGLNIIVELSSLFVEMFIFSTVLSINFIPTIGIIVLHRLISNCLAMFLAPLLAAAVVLVF